MTDIKFSRNTYTWAGLQQTPATADAVEMAKTAYQKALDAIRTLSGYLEVGDTALRLYVGGSTPPAGAADGDLWWGDRLRYEASHGTLPRTNLFTEQLPSIGLPKHYVTNGDKSVAQVESDVDAPEIRYVKTASGEFRAGFVLDLTGEQTVSFEFRSTEASGLRSFWLRTEGLSSEMDDLVVLESSETWMRLERTMDATGPVTVYLTPTGDSNDDVGDAVFIRRIVLEDGTDAGTYFNGWHPACSWEDDPGRSRSFYSPVWVADENIRWITDILQEGDWADGVVDIYVGAEPYLPEEGDLWDDLDALRRWDGLGWVVLVGSDKPALVDIVEGAVTDYSVEYAVGLSETVPPTTGWSANTPTRTPGTFIWFRAKVTYGTGDVTYTSPALLTGNTGAPGQDGADGLPGPPGADGQPTYTWLRYADSPTSGMSDSPVDKEYMGIATNKLTPVESDVYSDYAWSKIRGDDGVQGPPGEDGQTTYTWIKYADDASGTGMSNSPTGKAWIGIAHNKPTPTESDVAADYTWAKIRGDQGIPGEPGADGQTTYTWLKYADTPTSGMSDDPTGKDYIGLAYNKLTQTESTNYGDYTWSLIKGEQGDQGIPGPPGEDGQPTYIWIKYATSSTGAGMSDDPTGRTWIGVAYNKPVQTESTDPDDYTWSLIQGPPGEQGIQGPPGSDGQNTYIWLRYADTPTSGMSDVPTGKAYMGVAYNKTTPVESNDYSDYSWSLIQGPSGADGKGISSTEVRYQVSSSGTTAPTGTWLATVPATSAGQFLWTRTVTTYTDSNTSTAYSVAKHGDTGAGGRGITGTEVRYQVGSSGTTAPTGTWLSSVPATSPGQYLWTRTVTSYSSAPTSVTSYSVAKHGDTGAQGIQGPPGADGQPTYTWVRYAPNGNPTNAQMSQTPDGMTHIGFAFNKTTPTESDVASDYTWSKIQGDSGADGADGADGVSVTSITPYFQRLSSGASAPAKPTTSTPPSPWTSTEPAWQDGTVLYRTERIGYSNGSFGYTDVTRVATFDGISAAMTMANGKNRVTYSDTSSDGADIETTWTQNVTTGNEGVWFSSGTWVPGDPYLSSSAYAGLRYTGVPVTDAAVLVSATLTPSYFSPGSPGLYPTVAWAALDVDDAPAPDDGQRSLAQTPVAYHQSHMGPTALDVTQIVRQVVSRPGWSSGNAITFVGSMSVLGISLDIDPGSPLKIVYRTPVVLDPPTTAGRIEGDVHRLRNVDTGQIIREWVLDGTGNWKEVWFGDAVLTSLDVGKLTSGSINAAFDIAAGGEITAGVGSERQTVVGSQGIEYYNVIGEGTTRNLVSRFGEDMMILTPEGFNYGTTQYGDGNFRGASILEDPEIGGTALLGTMGSRLDEVDLDTPLGILDNLSFAGNAATYSSFSTAYNIGTGNQDIAEVMREQQAGRAVAVFVTVTVGTSAVQDQTRFTIEVAKTQRNLPTSMDPDKPTTSSPKFGITLYAQKNYASHVTVSGFVGLHTPNRSEVARWLIFGRNWSTVPWRVTDAQIHFFDLGPIDSSRLEMVNRVNTSSAPTPKKQYVSRWYADSIRRAQGSQVTSSGDRPGQALQGWAPGMSGDSYHTILGFTDTAYYGEKTKTISQALSGATIDRVRVRITHAGGYSGRTARLGLQSSSTAIPPSSPVQETSSFSAGQTRTTTLNSTFRSRLQSGQRYLTIGPDTRYQANYVAFHGTSGGNSARVMLEITYTR